SAPASIGVLSNDQDSDGNPLNALLVNPTSHGTVTLADDGSFTYVPSSGYTGSDAFTYKATDGTLNSNVATVSLQVLPTLSPPMASGETYSTTIGQSLNVATPGVLANDFDANGNKLSAQLSSPAHHGTVALNFDGSFTYTPNTTFVGVDTFAYVANNGVALS